MGRQPAFAYEALGSEMPDELLTWQRGAGTGICAQTGEVLRIISISGAAVSAAATDILTSCI